MADALGWHDDASVVQKRGAGMLERHGERTPRSAADPSLTVTTGARKRWRVTAGSQRKATQRDLDEPAPTLAPGHDLVGWTLSTGTAWRADGTSQQRTVDEPAPAVMVKSDTQWYRGRPATTVQGDVRVWPPGHKLNADDIAAGRAAPTRAGTDALRVELHELALLQGFPAGYPFVGRRQSVARQVGNALPPALLAAVIAANTGGG